MPSYPHHAWLLPQFRQKPTLPVDTFRGRAHKPSHASFVSQLRVGSLRYLLAIGGLLFGAAFIAVIWLVLPRADAPPQAAATLVAQAQEPAPAAAPEANVADSEGDGTLRVCNQTANPVSIALGYRAERGWQSEGWWVAGPSECKTVYSGSVETRRFYYIYAADDIGGGSWDGSHFMCTRDETFTIFGVEDCLARGYERTGFFEIDTQNRSSWMLQLTDNQVLGAEPVDGTDADLPLEGELEGGVPDGQPADGTDAEGAADQ
jgi:uncharacterized membrane protein